MYFSFDSGKSWIQPTYTGYTARGCTANFTTPVSACAQTEGPIGTPPWYEESGLVSDGDPGLASALLPGPTASAGATAIGSITPTWLRTSRRPAASRDLRPQLRRAVSNPHRGEPLASSVNMHQHAAPPVHVHWGLPTWWRRILGNFQHPPGSGRLRPFIASRPSREKRLKRPLGSALSRSRYRSRRVRFPPRQAARDRRRSHHVDAYGRGAGAAC
jgi:hypothetical protein